VKNAIISITTVALLLGGCATTQTTPKNCFDKERLEAREAKELYDAKNSLHAFKAEYQEMSSYINFLNDYIADYSKYIGAASQASSVIKLMPIPYAGQISSAAGFGAKLTVLASNASKSMVTLNNSIKTFESKLAAYEADKEPSKLESAQKFADETLFADITAAQQSLMKLKEGTASMLAISAATSQYYDSTSEAISKAASMFSKKEDAPKKAPDGKALKSKNDGFEQRSIRIFTAFDAAKVRIKNGSLVGGLKGEL
jgi:hypothetical protein